MGWSARVRQCAISALNSAESEDGVYEIVEGASVSTYSRAASNTMIPASISIEDAGTDVRRVRFTITRAEWSLYYQEIKEVGVGDKRVEFKDGTVFTVDNTGKLIVTRCIRGLDGTYTKSADKSDNGGILYKTASSSTDIKKFASCNWEKRVFSIGVEASSIDCGNRVYVGSGGNPSSIDGHAGTADASKQPSVRFVFNNTADECTNEPSFHPFAESVFPLLAGSRYYDAEITCHTNSVLKGSPSFSCLKQRWRVSSGDDVPECTPGQKQRFISLSGFTRAETIFNGSYEYTQTRDTG